MRPTIQIKDMVRIAIKSLWEIMYVTYSFEIALCYFSSNKSTFQLKPKQRHVVSSTTVKMYRKKILTSSIFMSHYPLKSTTSCPISAEFQNITHFISFSPRDA